VEELIEIAIGTNAPSIQRLFARGGSSLALAQPGGQPPGRCCSTILNRDEWPPFGTDEPTQRDLLVLLPVDTTSGSRICIFK